MKPCPDMVTETVAELGRAAPRCVFVGDSDSDMEAAVLSQTRAVGYAKTTYRASELAAAGAEVVIDRMDTLADALRLPA